MIKQKRRIEYKLPVTTIETKKKEKNVDKLLNRKLNHSILQNILTKIYKGKATLDSIKSELGTDNDNYVNLLQHLTQLKTKVKNIHSLKTFLNLSFKFRLSINFDTKYITNDKLSLNISILSQYSKFFEQFASDFSFYNLKYIEYYSNNIIYLPNNEKNNVTKYPFINFFIEDFNLNFSSNFPFLGNFYEGGKLKLNNIIIGDNIYRYFYLPFKQIESTKADVQTLLGKDATLYNLMNYYNTYQPIITLYSKEIYKKNTKEIDIFVMKNLLKKWEDINQIFTYSKENKEYINHLSYNKLSSGLYYINIKSKVTDAMPNYLYFPIHKDVNILSFFNYELDLAYYFEHITDYNNLTIKNFPLVCYTIDNLNCILQLSNVYNFICPNSIICEKYSSYTYQNLYEVYSNNKDMFQPLYKIWKSFLKVVTLFLDGSKNKMDLDKYKESFDLAQKWLGNYKSYLDSLANTNTTLFETLNKLKIPQYDLFIKKGEYIIKGIEKVANIIINKAIPEKHSPREVEDLLRGILFEISNNFMKTNYIEFKGITNIGYEGFIPLYRSHFHILGNILGSISEEGESKSQMRIYQKAIDKFIKDGFTAYAEQIKTDLEAAQYRKQIEQETAKRILKDYMINHINEENEKDIHDYAHYYDIDLITEGYDTKQLIRNKMDIEKTNKEKSELENLTKEKNKLIQEYEQKITKLNEQLQSKELELNEQISNYNQLRPKLNENEDNERKLKNEIQKLKDNINMKELELQNNQALINTLKYTINENEDNTKQLQSKILSLTNELSNTQTGKDSLNNKIQILKEQMESNKEHNTQLQSTLNDQLQKFNEKNLENINLYTKLSKAQKDLNDTTTQNQILQNKLTNLNQSLQEKDKNLNELNQSAQQEIRNLQQNITQNQLNINQAIQEKQILNQKINEYVDTIKQAADINKKDQETIKAYQDEVNKKDELIQQQKNDLQE